MIKALGFDWGGVLYGPPGKEYDKQLCHALSISLDKYKQVYYSMNELVNNGLMSRDEFDKQLLEKLRKSDKWDDFLKVRQQFYELKKINTNILNLVDQLKQKEYKVGLLSNNTRDARKRFERQGIAQHFDTIIISSEEGMSKPDPQIFRLFAQQLAVETTELLFIDDSENSLKTAEEVIYTPILYTGYDDLVEQLQALGIV